MHGRVLGILLLLTPMAWPAVAALPPQYQRLAELRAILNDPKITDRFDVRHPIDKLEQVQPDLYRLTGGDCHLDVAIENVPRSPPMPGPRLFKLAPGPLVCR
jgi:hypothetical protein